MAEPSPLYSLDVLQHAFVEMGLLRTKEVAQVCRAWAAGAQAAHSWWRGLLSAAEAEKERGNDCFRRGDTVSARNCYSRALEMLDSRSSRAWTAGVRGDASTQLELACLTNRAACYLKDRDAAAAAVDTCAAVFDSRLESARDAHRNVAAKAALRLVEAAEQHAGRISETPESLGRFSSGRAAARAAATEARHLVRPLASGMVRNAVEAEARHGLVAQDAEQHLELFMSIAEGCSRSGARTQA